ncbi:MAG: MBL fold metallo-hydrolase [Pyrinomonadaceae bacterium]
MKIQMLPSTIDANGMASARQHLLSIVIDDRVAIDAGCLAFSCTDRQREQVRDIVLTHTHLDHIAGLPLFIDDLFATLTEPIRIHATREMIEILERDLFNWAIYPRFSELSNDNGPIVQYCEFQRGAKFDVKHLSFQSVAVNHKVSANGYIVSDGEVSIAITGDTAGTDEIWEKCQAVTDLKAVLVECAFPDEFGELAKVSDHLTPKCLKIELEKLGRRDFPVFVINMKPMYREKIIEQVQKLGISKVEILTVGEVYEF